MVSIPTSNFASVRRKIRQAFDAGREYEKKTKPREAEKVPFPAYYQEWMEYWRKRAEEELKPKPHVIKTMLTCGGWNETENHASFDAAKTQRNAIALEFQMKGMAELGDAIIMADKVIAVKAEEGHPSPYTPAEIEAWVKAKVEEEMKGWRVVKGDRTAQIPLAGFSGGFTITDEWAQQMTPSGWRSGVLYNLKTD